MNKQFFYSLIIAGMALATAWAIRGQFGHEQGAAWAGGIGALAIILLSKRKDWYQKVFQITLASAVGWGVTGVMSYGQVVGYGRGSDFGNVYYGLLMLFVIGGIFGLLGGGMFGLALADKPEKRIHWPTLIIEMTVGGMIFYYVLIEILEWLMTPPRSEAWAFCLGMVVAKFWYMIRNGHHSALRVAIFAGVGAGFGFALGNFVQVIGTVSGIKFNFWNVMEYSIGFFGGIGMAYGTFTSEWGTTDETANKNKWLAPITIICLIIPMIVWDQSFTADKIARNIERAGASVNATTMACYVQWIALLLVFAFFGLALYRYYLSRKELITSITYDDVKLFFLVNLGIYTVYSLLITASFFSLHRIEQYLYIVNLVVIGLLIDKREVTFSNRGLNISRWTINLLFVLAIIALFTAVAISSHGGIPGAEKRFG
jgi:hypothetical protein